MKLLKRYKITYQLEQLNTRDLKPEMLSCSTIHNYFTFGSRQTPASLTDDTGS
jgi:hypothetical protein